MGIRPTIRTMPQAATIRLETIHEHIIKGCAKNHTQSQEALYNLMYTPMLKVCWRYSNDMLEATALYNAAMLKVLVKIDQYGFKGSFEGWVKRIVINTCIDHVRKNNSFKEVYIEDIKEIKETTSEYVYSKLQVDAIMQLIKTLPKNTATVFNMYVLDGYKHNEIATTIGISEGTSKWHLNEARRLLKIGLENLANTHTTLKHY